MAHAALWWALLLTFSNHPQIPSPTQMLCVNTICALVGKLCNYEIIDLLHMYFHWSVFDLKVTI